MPLDSRVARVTPAFADANLVLGRVDDVVLVNWRGFASLEDVTRQYAYLFEQVAAAPAPLSVLMVIDEDSVPPNAEVRNYIAEAAEELFPYLLNFAIVLEGTTVRQSLLRAVLAGMSILVSRSSARKQRVFGAVCEANVWLHDRGARVSSDELPAGVAKLRALHEIDGDELIDASRLSLTPPAFP